MHEIHLVVEPKEDMNGGLIINKYMIYNNSGAFAVSDMASYDKDKDVRLRMISVNIDI